MMLRTAVPKFLEDVKLRLSLNTHHDYSMRLGVVSRWWRANGYINKHASLAVSLRAMNKYFRFMIEGGSPRNTIKAYAITLRAFSTFLVRSNHARVNVFAGQFNPLRLDNLKIRETKPRLPMSKEEYETLLDYCQKNKLDDWYWVIRIGWESGLRSSDICRLCPEMIDFKARVVHIIPQKTRATSKELEIPISDDVANELKRRADNGVKRFFNYHQGLYDGKFRLYQAFRELAKEAGVKKTFHCLRHAFVTRLISDGVNPLVVMSITGHSMKSMHVYIKPQADVKRKAMGL